MDLQRAKVSCAGRSDRRICIPVHSNVGDQVIHLGRMGDQLPQSVVCGAVGVSPAGFVGPLCLISRIDADRMMIPLSNSLK